MKTSQKSMRLALGMSLALGAAVTTSTVYAYPFTAEQIAEQEAALLESVNRGYNLWHGSSPDTTTVGLACGNCHPDAAAANPQTFPKYVPMFGKVVPFREMVNWCIENPQLGKALDVNSDDMTAMEAYAFYLHRTRPIEPGLAARQTQPIVVEAGKGFPWKPSGIGVDK
ncbi:MAG: c-type cytochrome [Bdellovibrio bacteriovorus]